MPRVPYQPFQTAQPEVQGERVQVNTPGAAFGTNIAEGLQRIGQSTEQAGSELFQRAIALQDLRDQSDAREAQSDFATQSSLLHAQYSALQGKSAVDGLQPFLDAQRQLREKIGGALTAPMAKRYYDADSLPFMQRNVFSAAGHAATENLRFTVDTLNAQTDLDVKSTSDDPYNEDFVDQKRSKIKADVTQATMLHAGTDDPNSPIVQDAVTNALSRQRKEQILGLARTDPVAATQLSAKYNGDLTEPDRIAVQGMLEGRTSAVFGSNLAQQVYQEHVQPDGTLDITNADAEKEIRDRAKTLMPDNPLVADTAVLKWQGLQFHDRWARTQDKAETVSRIDAAIGQYGVTDTQQLLAIPGMDKEVEKYAKLDPKGAATLQQHIFNINVAANRVTREESLRQLTGMSNNDVGSFLAVDPYDPKWHLSANDADRLAKRQLQLSKEPRDDPRVNSALTLLRGSRGAELQALGIYKRDPNNPDDYDHFTGALQEAITIWQQDHGNKAPSATEVMDQIGPEVLSKQITKQHWWGTTYQEPAYQSWTRPEPQDVPADWAAGMTRKVMEAGGAQPTQQQLYEAYIREQYLKLYGAAQATESTAPGSK